MACFTSSRWDDDEDEIYDQIIQNARNGKATAADMLSLPKEMRCELFVSNAELLAQYGNEDEKAELGTQVADEIWHPYENVETAQTGGDNNHLFNDDMDATFSVPGPVRTASPDPPQPSESQTYSDYIDSLPDHDGCDAASDSASIAFHNPNHQNYRQYLRKSSRKQSCRFHEFKFYHGCPMPYGGSSLRMTHSVDDEPELGPTLEDELNDQSDGESEDYSGEAEINRSVQIIPLPKCGTREADPIANKRRAIMATKYYNGEDMRYFFGDCPPPPPGVYQRETNAEDYKYSLWHLELLRPSDSRTPAEGHAALFEVFRKMGADGVYEMRDEAELTESGARQPSVSEGAKGTPVEAYIELEEQQAASTLDDPIDSWATVPWNTSKTTETAEKPQQATPPERCAICGLDLSSEDYFGAVCHHEDCLKKHRPNACAICNVSFVDFCLHHQAKHIDACQWGYEESEQECGKSSCTKSSSYEQTATEEQPIGFKDKDIAAESPVVDEDSIEKAGSDSDKRSISPTPSKGSQSSKTSESSLSSTEMKNSCAENNAPSDDNIDESVDGSELDGSPENGVRPEGDARKQEDIEAAVQVHITTERSQNRETADADNVHSNSEAPKKKPEHWGSEKRQIMRLSPKADIVEPLETVSAPHIDRIKIAGAQGAGELPLGCVAPTALPIRLHNTSKLHAPWESPVATIKRQVKTHEHETRGVWTSIVESSSRVWHAIDQYHKWM